MVAVAGKALGMESQMLPERGRALYESLDDEQKSKLIEKFMSLPGELGLSEAQQAAVGQLMSTVMGGSN